MDTFNSFETFVFKKCPPEQNYLTDCSNGIKIKIWKCYTLRGSSAWMIKPADTSYWKSDKSVNEHVAYLSAGPNNLGIFFLFRNKWPHNLSFLKIFSVLLREWELCILVSQFCWAAWASKNISGGFSAV